jgi:conjugal transfer/entry exclusion protein
MLDFRRLLTMRTKYFRSILAVSTVAASITINLSPAQAFTWDDLMNTVRTGLEKGLIDAAQSAAQSSEQLNVPNNNSNPPQGGNGMNNTPDIDEMLVE